MSVDTSYDEFKGKTIASIENNPNTESIFISFTDGTKAEVYNQGEIINGEIELEIDLRNK
jgi:hypothetical protein